MGIFSTSVAGVLARIDKDSTIENKLTSSVRDISRIVTKSKSRDKKQQGKYNEMVKTLIDEYGYNEDSAEEVIKFAANNLWRDS